MAIRVFVYGTLKPGEANYQNYCQGQVISSIEAYTFGNLFDFPHLGYPAMTEGNNPVGGYLLIFADLTILDRLDFLEDYNSHRPPESNEYQRQLIPIYSPSHELLGDAWAYFMTPVRVTEGGGILLLSGWWTGNQGKIGQLPTTDLLA
jgi:gamma-glutamylcyclotransferase (GGCT)/AIG2-like uncharacterized protein YtfP